MVKKKEPKVYAFREYELQAREKRGIIKGAIAGVVVCTLIQLIFLVVK